MEFEKSSLCRVMVFGKMIEVGNLVFQKIAEVGNLSWAVSTWEKTGQKPESPPPWGGGRLFLSAQNFCIREPIECIANISGIVKLPAAYKRVRERLDCVAVERLQDVNQARCNSAHGLISNALTALKRH